MKRTINHPYTSVQSVACVIPFDIKGPFGLKALRFPIIVLLVSLLFALIFQVNSLVSETYEIKARERELSQLFKESKFLEINSAQMKSLVKIEDAIKDSDFVKVEKISYIRTGDNSMARK